MAHQGLTLADNWTRGSRACRVQLGAQGQPPPPALLILQSRSAPWQWCRCESSDSVWSRKCEGPRRGRCAFLGSVSAGSLKASDQGAKPRVRSRSAHPPPMSHTGSGAHREDGDHRDGHAPHQVHALARPGGRAPEDRRGAAARGRGGARGDARGARRRQGGVLLRRRQIRLRRLLAKILSWV